MAAEYEVNIKINTQQIERELGKIDKVVSKIGKPKSGSKKSGLLIDDAEVKRLQKSRIYLGQSVQSIDRLAKIQDRRARSLNKINELEAKGISVSKLRKQLAKATTEQSKRRLGSAEKEFRVLEKIIRLEQSKLRILKDQQKGFLSSPIRGTTSMMGSPAQIAASARAGGPSSPIGGSVSIAGSPAARRAGRQRLEQVGLGAGFPLLFGGGAGSVIGGGLGGLTGSFGAQIALSAIGQQIDQFVAGIVNAGKALTSVGGAAEFMAEKSLFSSDAMQFRIEKLIEEGDVTKAAALMTQEMAKQVGGSGLKALKDLGTEASKMGKLFGTVMLRIQAFMAQALTPLIKLINSAIGGMVAQSQLDQMLAEAGSPERRAAILARSNELRGTKKQGRASIGRNDFTMEMLQTLQSEYPALIPEGAAIEPTRLETLRAGDSRTSDQKRQERLIEASNRRIANLKAEAVKVKEVSAIRGRIAAAQAAENDQLVERLRGEERAAGILREKARLLAAIPDDLDEAKRLEEETQIVLTTDAKLLANQEKTQRRIAKVIRDEQLKAVKELEQVYQGVGDIVKEGLVDGIQSAIRGTKSLTEVLSNMFDRLSNKFLDLAANLALYGNQQGTLSKGSGLFGSLFSAVLPALIPGKATMGGSGYFDPITGKGTAGPNFGLAKGGYVSAPSVIGFAEKEPEYAIPASKMTEAMGRYARGARGAAVIPEGDGASTEGGMGGGSGVVDVRYSVERINNVDYVTAAEFERGMNQAAKRGAELGRQSVYSDLVNKRSVRSRVGV